MVTAAIHIGGQLVTKTGLDQFAETEVKANATAKVDVSHHVAEIHADLGLDRLSKCLSPCPAAERPHWLRQPLAR